MALYTSIQNVINKGALNEGDRITGFIRFAFTGGAATLTYLIAFFILQKHLNLDAKTLSLIAYACGFCVSYTGQSFFTFKQTGHDSDQFRKFIILSILGAALSWVIIAICNDGLGLKPMWGAVVTAGLIPLISFLGMNFWVFLKRAA